MRSGRRNGGHGGRRRGERWATVIGTLRRGDLKARANREKLWKTGLPLNFRFLLSNLPPPLHRMPTSLPLGLSAQLFT